MTAKLDALAGQMSSGAISPIEFYQQAFSVIEFGNARAAVLGSFRAKRHNPPSDIAIRVAARASEEQRGFLLRFARDLAEGKYRPKSQGGKGARQRLARFALYSARLAGTANESWLQTTIAMNPEEEGLWELGRRDRHCSDCRGQAARGWILLRLFTFMPGQGKTRCFLLCGCSVKTRSGAQSYVLS
jgi:hypothetical protein